VNAMNTAAIDTNTLNSLFDNQKKLDEIFDSIFDDNNFFINTTSPQTESRYSSYDVSSPVSYSGSNVRDPLFSIKQNPLYCVLPIALEIAVIYLLVTNLF
jgi:hypothetical protein